MAAAHLPLAWGLLPTPCLGVLGCTGLAPGRQSWGTSLSPRQARVAGQPPSIHRVLARLLLSVSLTSSQLFLGPPFPIKSWTEDLFRG